LRLFADENIEREIVAWLRSEGHDVLWAAESAPAMSDEEILHRAKAESRVLVTNDLDFGQLVFRRGLTTSGVLLLRFEEQQVACRLRSLSRHWSIIREQLAGRFTVVTETRIRARPIPSVGTN